MIFKTLKANILLYFILFAIIPLMIGSSVVLYQMYKAKESSFTHRYAQILRQAVSESDDIANNIEYIGKYLKNNYSNKNYYILNELIKTQKNISTIIILDNIGIIQNFKSSLKTNISIGFDYSNTDYFNKIKSGKKEYWSEVYLSQATGLPSISYSLRIDDNTICVLVVNLKSLHTFANKFKSTDNTTMVMITDNNGVFLANPDKMESVAQREDILSSDLYKKFILKKYVNKEIIFNINNTKYIGIFGISNRLKWTIIVKENYNVVFDTFSTLILFIILFIIILVIISILFAFKLSKSILKPLDTLDKNMDDIAHDKTIKSVKISKYKEINKLSDNFLIMQQKIKDRENENRQKDKQIFKSEKMASMGEMIGNIAHQWRQPLSVISTASTGMQVQKEYDILTDELFYESCNRINDNVQYLSKTIDDFRNFIKGDRIKIIFSMKDLIDSFLRLVEGSAKSNNISIILDIEDNLNINGYKNELIQCIMNIFNNSKDALIDNNKDNRFIFISGKEENNQAVIIIKDNAGGIPKDIISKIFDPYFTTKHQSNGTGLGLHMSYNLITEGMNGTLDAINTIYEVKEKKYTGALFTIKIPK